MAINTLSASSLLEREIALKEICSELNQFVDLKNVLYTIISRLQSLTNIEAVGVRLKNGFDYPYFVYDGFDKKFIQKENSLCVKDGYGCPVPKVGGDGYKLECMCGSVINGQIDPSLDFFTKKGSFWTNGTTRLLAETPPEQLKGTRNECNSSGYESVALVPIKSKGKNIGLIQFNDRRESMFTEELIEFLQMIGEQVGLAVENSMIYDRLHSQKKELEEHLEELKRTQNQLVEARKNSCLGSLVAGVSHELNTPVSNALMGIHILIDDGLKVFDKLREQELTENDLELYLNNHNELTQIILRNIEHISELTKSFKQTALSQVKEEKVVFKLKSFLLDIIASIKPTIKTKNIEFELEIEDHLEVKSYPGLFFQIFTNLIMNSFVHGFENKKDGTIIIGCKTMKSFYSLFYRDNGKGISDELFPKVLEPFITSKKSSCTGLGLSIVNNIVTNNLKGELEYGNNRELGVFFKLHIPK